MATTTTTPSMAAPFTGTALSAPDMAVQQFTAIVRGIVNIFAVPAELFMRLSFGTRYISIATMFLAAWPAAGACILASLFGGSGYLIGPGTIWGAYSLGQIFHWVRIGRSMANMDREKDSEVEGAAWPLFNILPHGKDWNWQRLLYEPLTLFLFGAILTKLHIMAPYCGAYFGFLAFCLALKNALTWYTAWEFVRNWRDKQARLPIIMRMSEGKQAPVTVGRFTLSGLPKNTPPMERARVAAELAGLTKEMQDLISPIERT